MAEWQAKVAWTIAASGSWANPGQWVGLCAQHGVASVVAWSLCRTQGTQGVRFSRSSPAIPRPRLPNLPPIARRRVPFHSARRSLPCAMEQCPSLMAEVAFGKRLALKKQEERDSELAACVRARTASGASTNLTSRRQNRARRAKRFLTEAFGCPMGDFPPVLASPMARPPSPRPCASG